MALLPSCSSEYPIAPTFCDDWCEATKDAKCRDNPHGCVRNCELTRAGPDCFPLQEALLACYRSAPSDALICNERERAVVQDGSCEAERDALFECEAPGISVCLSDCRILQDAALTLWDDSLALPTVSMPPSGFGNFGQEETEGPEQQCRLLSNSCERLCWAGFTFSSPGLVAAGVVPQSPTRVDAGAAFTLTPNDAAVSLADSGTRADAGGPNAAPLGSDPLSSLCILAQVLTCNLVNLQDTDIGKTCPQGTSRPGSTQSQEADAETSAAHRTSGE